MPITISNRNVGSGNGSLMTPILANNPAFKVEILPVDGRLEQMPYAKDGSKEIEAIKVGQLVHGQILSSKKSVKGKVLQINQKNGQIVSYKVLDKDGKDRLLDPTTTVKYSEHGEDDETVGATAYGIDNSDEEEEDSNESIRVHGYHNWLARLGS
jgi:hypothetical protein